MRLIKNIVTICLISFAMVSCKKEDPLVVDNISGLGGDTTVKGPIDYWILDSLTIPYNIDVQYKWNQFLLNQLDKTVVPVKEEVVIPVLDAMKRVWIDVYISEAGDIFFKKYCPKFFVLAGSAAYGLDGSALLGQAGGGRQIFLLQLNYFRNKTMLGYVPSDTLVQLQTFHTIEHEFTHIFDQNIKRPLAFDQVCQGFYSSDWINTTDAAAQKKGFITAYASSVAAEDFAEMTSLMLINGKNGFDSIVRNVYDTTANPRNLNDSIAMVRLQQKESIIRKYFQDSWSINFDSLQAKTRAAIDKEFY